MPLYKPKRSPYWWINLQNPHGGSRLRESTKIHHDGNSKPCKQAQEIHDRRQAEVWQIKSSGRSFDDALNEWLDAEPRSKKDENAIAQIKSLYKNRPLTAVTGDSIVQTFYRRTRTPKPGQKQKETQQVSAGTYNRLANIIRSAMNIALEKKWVDRVDKIPRKKEPKPTAKFITKKQFEELFARLAEHQKPLFLFALETGLRWSNVTYLEWDRVNMQLQMAWIDGDEAKGGEDIPVPLSKRAIEVLHGQIGKSDRWVFPMPEETDKRHKRHRGTPINSPKNAFNRARKAAGLSNFKWHGIRNTWASWHVMNGTPLNVLQELGGWKDPKMVERYAKLAPGYVAQFAGNSKPYENNVVTITKQKRKRSA